ncbi:cysteine desulfurase [Alteromonas sp. MB-3u-76]|uniref:cysteine desulfurase family protein n=1 Tax=Alteromonas sp. MB-3u-76 TaxID=2058133 RepID=UPI000C30A236|nr:cysteine desulfurase family protein [Alteromonas sp. MB-3u-76]AUC86831.1 cysteine desulfurase [Alteromonas sp. MB-3u-76]
MIYLDSAASYPVLPEVQVALDKSFRELYGNSTASHKLGLDASEVIESARDVIADKIGALSSEVVFTSGATESNNIAFKSLLLDNPALKHKKHIVTSQIEHKCVLAICNYLAKFHGYRISYVKPNADGVIQADELAKVLQDDTALVSIMHVNNELGTINPIGDIGELCFKKGILFHSDAAQSFCKVDIDVDELNVDVMSFSAHKIGGPKGIGAIYIRDLRTRYLTPVVHGAGQENGLRGGTVASPLIDGFAASVDAFPRYYEKLKEAKLKYQFIEHLTAMNIDFKVNGNNTNILDSIVSISFPELDIPSLFRMTDDSIAIAQGSACSSKQIEPSHVLSAIELKGKLLENTLRLSFTHFTIWEDLNKLLESIRALKNND